MADNPVDNAIAKSEPRTVGQHVIFWLLWGILIIPAIILLTGFGQLELWMLLPVLMQLVIHGISLQWFLDTAKPFSKSMLMLLGGTGLLYFLALGSCVVLLMGLSGSSFH